MGSKSTELHTLPSGTQNSSSLWQREFLCWYTIWPHPAGQRQTFKGWASDSKWARALYQEAGAETRSLLIRAVRREHQRTMENEETWKGLFEFLRMLWLLDPAKPFSLLSGPLREFKEVSVTRFQKCLNSYDLGLPSGKFYFEQVSINPPWKRGQEWFQMPQGKIPTSQKTHPKYLDCVRIPH